MLRAICTNPSANAEHPNPTKRTFTAHIRRELQRVVQDPLVHRLDVLVIERRETRLGESQTIDQKTEPDAPSSRTTRHQASTSRPSLCIPGCGGVRERCIRVCRRRLDEERTDQPPIKSTGE